MGIDEGKKQGQTEVRPPILPAKPSLPPMPPAQQSPPVPPATPLLPSITAPEQAPQPKQGGEASDEMVTTGVDDLIKLLSDYPKLSLEEVSRRLNVSKKVLKSWIDFLVEEKILGIEYSFTTPYVYLNRPVIEERARKIREERLTYALYREEFYEKARKSNMPEEKLKGYWEEHLKSRLEQNKDFFMHEIQKRSLPRGDELWAKYKQHALSQ